MPRSNGSRRQGKRLTPEAVRDMVKSGGWALKIPRQGPVGLSIPKQRRFDHRMQMVRIYVNADASLGDLAESSKKRGWSDRTPTRQNMYFHLSTAIHWLTSHGCLVKTDGSASR